MSSLLNSDLIRWIACPECNSDLFESDHRLNCIRCHAEYEIKNGFPLLYLPGVNIDHLKEEENLARMMKDSRKRSAKEQFSLHQWDISKQEFWQMVKANIQSPPRLFINIGCGYDHQFSQFEEQGHEFINFDMVHGMLDTLHKEFGAKSCICGDVNRLPFKKNVFDYVVSIDLLHHESDKVFALLKSFRDLLKPGGMLFLEDVNAWGMFQIAKSILLPKPLHRSLRSFYHRLKRSVHRPADYEFPTSVWRVKNMLKQLGFHSITMYPNTAYPCISRSRYRFYKLISYFKFVRKYHNYHYMLSAVRQ